MNNKLTNHLLRALGNLSRQDSLELIEALESGHLREKFIRVLRSSIELDFSVEEPHDEPESLQAPSKASGNLTELEDELMGVLWDRSVFATREELVEAFNAQLGPVIAPPHRSKESRAKIIKRIQKILMDLHPESRRTVARRLLERVPLSVEDEHSELFRILSERE